MLDALVFVRRIWAGLCLLACTALATQAASAMPCDGAQRIRLRVPVELSAQERAQLRALPPLRIFAVNAPPMAQYEKDRDTYTGISPDVLCFMAQQTGLRYEFITRQELTVAEKIRQVQEGRADVFVPLSHQPERARKGIFTKSYYASQYAAIARKGRRLSVGASTDLAQYRVGFIGGVALEPILRDIVPASQLHSFDTSVVGKGLFQALRSDAIDVAVFNTDFFSQERYRHDLFDLEIIQTLSEFPRAYSFYFSRTPEHERVVAVLDRYLAVMDISASLEAHEVGERLLMERYVAQRSQRTLLLAASLAAALLALASYVALRKHRNLSLRLAASHAQILAQQQALQAANEELERLSQTDGLTRLANRRHFDLVLAREHANHRRTGAPLSLLLIDVDHFKRVNDHFGHAVGDDYLRAVARTLERGVARATDLVARYGGEEFACLLPDTDPENARAVAERIRAGVAELDLPNPQADIPYLTVSIGLASLQGGEYGAPDLLASADAQLYAAKQAGRNNVRSTVLSSTPVTL
ncbi:MAG: GGDEF domain-containing protein [Giesbergeria sp.]